jgi:hypothetical protein
MSPATAAADEQLVARLAARARSGRRPSAQAGRPPARGRDAVGAPGGTGSHLQPVLCSGGLDVVRQWGRVGGRHRPRRLATSHATEGAARAALLALLRRRLRRGYLPAR